MAARFIPTVERESVDLVCVLCPSVVSCFSGADVHSIPAIAM